jgi:hypothetical protein
MSNVTLHPTKADRAAAHRACATVADVLGRDPQAKVFVGGTCLLSRDEGRETRARKKPKTAGGAN